MFLQRNGKKIKKKEGKRNRKKISPKITRTSQKQKHLPHCGTAFHQVPSLGSRFSFVRIAEIAQLAKPKKVARSTPLTWHQDWIQYLTPTAEEVAAMKRINKKIKMNSTTSEEITQRVQITLALAAFSFQ